MEENVRKKLIEAVRTIAASEEIIESALSPLPLNIGKGDLLEKLYFQLTERKLFKSKSELAQFAVEHNLSQFAKSTLAEGGLTRVMFDAFDAPIEDLRTAVEKLCIMRPVNGRTTVYKPRPRNKKNQPSRKLNNWGATIREHHLPSNE